MQQQNGTNHNREDQGSLSGLDEPQYTQTKQLNQCEDMDPIDGNLTQIHQIRLMLDWHENDL